MSYIAPVKDMLFDIEHLARIEEIAKLPGFEDAGLDTAQAVLEECARFNQDVVAPLNVRLAGPAAPGRLRWPGPAQDHRCSLWRDAELGQHELRAVPLAQ